MMDKKVKSLQAQYRAKTLERNTAIALRAIGGEPQVRLAEHYGITKQAISHIVQRYGRLNNEDSILPATDDSHNPVRSV